MIRRHSRVMPSTTISSRSRLVDYASRLPSLPGVALEVVRLSRKDWVGLDEIAAVITRDPALSAKLLKLANSPLYVRRQPAASMKDAFRVLGLKAVRMAALSFSVIDLAGSGGDFHGFDFRVFWRRSIVQAVFGRMLCKLASEPFEDEAFTAGLLMDLGVPILSRLGGANYLAVVAAMEAGHPDRELERAYAGVTHDQLVGLLMKDWGLPEDMITAATLHHDPEAATEKTAVSLSRILYAAHCAGDFFTVARKGEALQALRRCLMRWFSLSSEQCDTLLADVAPHVETMAGVVQVDIGGALEIEDLLDAARGQLVSLSLAATGEAERATERAVLAEQRSLIDALTGLANRAAFDATLAAAFAARRRGRSSDPFVLVMIDIDHFKLFNDGYGHQAGDAVLKGVADVLRRFARPEDAVCRYGGEEFAVVVSGADSVSGRALAERLRRAIEKAEIVHEGATHRVTASFGVAAQIGDPGSSTHADLVRAADSALYCAKDSGRNRVVTA